MPNVLDPKPLRVSRSKKKEHWRYVLSHDTIQQLLKEALENHLYLDGKPGTKNRMTFSVVGVWDSTGNHCRLQGGVGTWVDD